MDVVEVAVRARSALEGGQSQFGHRAYFAIVGFLDGVISGHITRGSRLLGELLLGPEKGSIVEYPVGSTYGADSASCHDNLEEDQKIVLRDLFASGMCTEGQQLKGLSLGKENWVERS